MLSIKECSEKAIVSQKTIRRHIHAKILKAEKINNSYRIDDSIFSKWCANLLKNKRKINETKIFKIKGKDIPNIFDEININQLIKKDYWKKPNKNGFKFADFFSGAGGLTTGFVQAGFTPIHSVEIMPQATETYNRNISLKFGEELLDARDITNNKIKKQAIKKLNDKNVDIIIGGFPCQGFSMAGNRVVDDPRNSLYMHMLEIVIATQPKIVIMENVTGLRSMLDGKVEKKIIADYKKAGYNISIKTLNSADYGTPQQRKRVIFIANKIDKINLYPKPIFEPLKYKTVKFAIEDLLSLKEDASINHIFTKHNKDMIMRLSKVKEGNSLYDGYSDAWKKVYWDKPSPTVKENHGGVFIHPKANRVMTPRELARLQSFPDDFIFEGTKKWQLIQIGNAVPPKLSKAIAVSIKEMLK